MTSSRCDYVHPVSCSRQRRQLLHIYERSAFKSRPKIEEGVPFVSSTVEYHNLIVIDVLWSINNNSCVIKAGVVFFFSHFFPLFLFFPFFSVLFSVVLNHTIALPVGFSLVLVLVSFLLHSCHSTFTGESLCSVLFFQAWITQRIIYL